MFCISLTYQCHVQFSQQPMLLTLKWLLGGHHFFYPPLTFFPGLQLFLIFCLSLFHHQNCCFQLLLVGTATVVLNMPYSLDLPVTFPLVLRDIFSVPCQFLYISQDLLEILHQHRVSVSLLKSLFLLGSQPCTAKDVHGCSCSHTCACVSVCNYF